MISELTMKERRADELTDETGVRWWVGRRGNTEEGATNGYFPFLVSLCIGGTYGCSR